MNGCSLCTTSRSVPTTTSRPSKSTAMRLESATSVSRSWVTITTVSASSRRSCSTSRTKLSLRSGSRPAVGSSRNRSSGSSARARASAARFTMPPESSAGTLWAWRARRGRRTARPPGVDVGADLPPRDQPRPPREARGVDHHAPQQPRRGKQVIGEPEHHPAHGDLRLAPVTPARRRKITEEQSRSSTSRFSPCSTRWSRPRPQARESRLRRGRRRSPRSMPPTTTCPASPGNSPKRPNRISTRSPGGRWPGRRRQNGPDSSPARSRNRWPSPRFFAAPAARNQSLEFNQAIPSSFGFLPREA